MKLSQIEEKHKDGLLKEYFNLCKMVYRINSIISYNWYQGTDSFDLIFSLYNQN